MTNKGSTSIVGYIAMLMIAWAALGHGEAPLSANGLQTNAVAFNEIDPSYFSELPVTKKIRIEIWGKTYDAVILDSNVESDKIKLSY